MKFLSIVLVVLLGFQCIAADDDAITKATKKYEDMKKQADSKFTEIQEQIKAFAQNTVKSITTTAQNFPECAKIAKDQLVKAWEETEQEMEHTKTDVNEKMKSEFIDTISKIEKKDGDGWLAWAWGHIKETINAISKSFNDALKYILQTVDEYTAFANKFAKKTEKISDEYDVCRYTPKAVE